MKRLSQPSNVWLLPLLLFAAVASSCMTAPSAMILSAPDSRIWQADVPVVQSAGLRQPDGKRLVENYNSRNLGDPASRRVTLELFNGEDLTRSFTVENFWAKEGNETRTLFVLEEPKGLRGTNFLLVENPAFANELQMKVRLMLPAGERKFLELRSERFDEGLLGSDFTYSDMRMCLPTSGYDYKVVGSTTLLNEPVWVLERRTLNSTSSAHSSFVRFYLAERMNLILGADFYRKVRGEQDLLILQKQMRVEGFKKIDGVYTATRIAMYADDQRVSVLSLKEIRFGLKEKSRALDSLEALASAGQGKQVID